MAKAKVKKHDIWIDMTAMSDVTVLLLCFFMLTSTFIQAEPVQVVAPSSVSDFSIPESNLMTILVDPNGKVFLNFTNRQDRVDVLTAVGEDYGITFTPQQLATFTGMDMFGVPIQFMGAFLDMPAEVRDSYLKDLENIRVGIPAEALSDANGVIAQDNEFQRWVNHATTNNRNLQIAIKADQTTAYPVIEKVISDLRDLRQNRLLLLTNLRAAAS
jgi:biopolymer transport protein ExbD